MIDLQRVGAALQQQCHDLGTPRRDRLPDRRAAMRVAGIDQVGISLQQGRYLRRRAATYGLQKPAARLSPVQELNISSTPEIDSVLATMVSLSRSRRV